MSKCHLLFFGHEVPDVTFSRVRLLIESAAWCFGFWLLLNFFWGGCLHHLSLNLVVDSCGELLSPQRLRVLEKEEGGGATHKKSAWPFG